MYHLSEDECQLLQSCVSGARIKNRIERTSSFQRLLELGLVSEVTVNFQDLVHLTDAGREALRERSLIFLTDAGREALRQRNR